MVSRYQQVLSMRWKSIREMGTQCGEDTLALEMFNVRVAFQILEED